MRSALHSSVQQAPVNNRITVVETCLDVPLRVVRGRGGTTLRRVHWPHRLLRQMPQPALGMAGSDQSRAGNMNIRETAPRITELEKISTRTDTRDYLAKAASTKEKLKDWLVVDVDAHVNETAF